jgi:hypothetical protein
MSTKSSVTPPALLISSPPHIFSDLGPLISDLEKSPTLIGLFVNVEREAGIHGII